MFIGVEVAKTDSTANSLINGSSKQKNIQSQSLLTGFDAKLTN